MNWTKQKTEIKKQSIYKSDCGSYKGIFTRIGSNLYFDLLNINDLSIIPTITQNGGTKFGVKGTLQKASELLSKFDFNSNEIGQNKKAHLETLYFNNSIKKN